MSTYRRVTYADRCQISALMQVGFTKTMIAESLFLHKSTIGREIKRNSLKQDYNPEKANYLYLNRYKNCRRHKVINGALRERIIDLVKDQWSPQLIAGRLRREKVTRVSHDTIYNFIDSNHELAIHLRRFGRRGGGRFVQRKSRKNRQLSIALRPKIVNERKRLGDWERDGMYVANRNQLLVCVDRKSRYTVLAAIGHGKPKEVTNITAKLLNSLPIKSYTITNDNGPENRDSSSQEWPVYHCDPGKPQQRGTVENTIGLLRQYITRKTSIESLNEKELDQIANQLNSRPRRCLDYLTPYEVMFGVKVALVT